ncbi:diacylglycerol/lipid kinase family protein [Olsenella phocaeensis]|uniref:diacylglycerol/lipid kinase family protein n=1 Tax=Olsenella phocaeensis TaxID=1852385 RepID=UPI003A95C2B1
MAILRLGRTLVVANPASHSGKGAEAAERARRFFESYTSATESFELVMTEGPEDAKRLAAGAAQMDTLIVLGGDGVIHEATNGLMTLPTDARPALAVIPMGSGNDFARTISATYNDPELSLAELLGGRRVSIDLGHVTNEHGQGTHFVETLSFGLDAAIALDTTDRRAANTSQEGSMLFATSGVKVFSSGHKGYPCCLRLDDGDPQELRALILAVQNGPTYGGGFRVCPDALPNDGMLDVCYNVKVPSIPRLLALFGLARSGRHVRSRVIRAERARRLQVEFEGEGIPCQVDGERFEGRRFEVEVEPRALDVLVPARCGW